MDAALVRYVYDVARISQLQPGALDAARKIFPQLVISDRDEFKGQHPQFDKDPVAVLRRTLEAAKTNGELRARYHEQLLPLVYDQVAPSFEECFERFEVVALDFLSVC